jgi:hypothetical protein
MSTTIASSNSNADTVAAALPPPPFNANFEPSEEFRATVVGRSTPIRLQWHGVPDQKEGARFSIQRG